MIDCTIKKNTLKRGEMKNLSDPKDDNTEEVNATQ